MYSIKIYIILNMCTCTCCIVHVQVQTTLLISQHQLQLVVLVLLRNYFAPIISVSLRGHAWPVSIFLYHFPSHPSRHFFFVNYSCFPDCQFSSSCDFWSNLGFIKAYKNILFSITVLLTIGIVLFEFYEMQNQL